MIRLALALLICAAPAFAQGRSDATSPAGTGPTGPGVQAGNRDCPARGAAGRVISVPSAPGAPSCAPTGAGPGTGATPVPPHAPATDKSSPDTRETPGRAGQ